MSQVIVVGGGAAGMMAAICSAKEGNQVVLLEKNEKLGKDVYKRQSYGSGVLRIPYLRRL